MRQHADAELRAFRIRRVKEENFAIKEAKIDLGKAVKKSEAKEAA